MEEGKELDIPGINSDFWSKEDFSKHALFASELPEDVTSDPTLAALAEISGEDNLANAEEKAIHWKNVGNDNMKEGRALGPRRYKDAMNAYDRALEVLVATGLSTGPPPGGWPGIDSGPSPSPSSPAGDGKGEMSEAGKALAPRINLLEAQIYSNRALANIRLKQYTEAVEDAKRAVFKAPNYLKPYFHAARASQLLELPTEVVKWCDRATAAADQAAAGTEGGAPGAPGGPGAPKSSAAWSEIEEFEKLRKWGEDELARRRAAREAREKEGKKEEDKKWLETLAAVRERGLRYEPLKTNEFEFRASLEETGEEGTKRGLLWPVILVFEKCSITEVLARVHEEATLEEVLEAAQIPQKFDPKNLDLQCAREWDVNNDFYIDNIEVHCQGKPVPNWQRCTIAQFLQLTKDQIIRTGPVLTLITKT